VRKFLAVPILLILCMVVYSCARTVKRGAAEGVTRAGTSAQAAPPAAQGQPPSQAPPVSQSPRPATPPQRSIASAGKQQPGPIALQPRAEGGVAILFAQGLDRKTMPEDFLIGALADTGGGKSEEMAAIGVARAFLTSVVSGALDRKLLAADGEAGIADMIAYGMEQGYAAKSFRLGSPKKHENGEVTASVRLLGNEGSSEGEIYVSRAGKEWLVSDFQINLAQLAVKREKPKDRFFPSAYRWLLEE